MSGLKYALAMLGVGGAAAAVATEADASTIVTLDLSPYDAPVDIALFGGSPAQYYYGAGIAKVAPFTSGPAAVFGAYADATVGANVDVFGAFPGTTPYSGEVKLGVLVPDAVDPTVPVYSQIPSNVDTYLNLQFSHGGTNYAGTAHVDATGYLRTIEYDVAAVPEPAAWALMIGGFGLAGAAIRNRRRQALAA